MALEAIDPVALAAAFEPVVVEHGQDWFGPGAGSLPGAFPGSLPGAGAGAGALPGVGQYERMLLCVLVTILDRAERDAAYGFVDTKIDLISGEDFAAADPLRGRGTVYLWIQGRGMEALAGHAAWISQCASLAAAQREQLVERIRRVLATVTANVQRLRTANDGRLWFMMTPSGQPLGVDGHGHVVPRSLPADAPANFSDLFCCKGLAAAASLLGDSGLLQEAQRMFSRVCDDIWGQRFTSDQQPMDPKNPVKPVAGRFSLGPAMIAIGAAALFVELTAARRYVQFGIELIEHIWTQHVKRPGVNIGFGLDYDVWEFVDSDSRPYREGGAVRSDPGHATEFVGLSLKFLRVCDEQRLLDGELADRARYLRPQLRHIVSRSFRNGFHPRGIGICKAYDLVSRTTLNGDMPWWSLPETMRAAMEAWATAADVEKPAYADIARRCSNAFVRYYVRPDRGLMANQTLGVDGRVVAAIPATPDVDPGYHTGLSVIDSLKLLQLHESACHAKK